MCACKCAHICGCMCVLTCVHVSMCMWLYMYVHTCVWQDQCWKARLRGSQLPGLGCQFELPEWHQEALGETK